MDPSIAIPNDPGSSRAVPALEKAALELMSHGGVPLAGIPIFLTATAHILRHVSGTFRVFARNGYTECMSWRISVRDPEFPHIFWTNPLSRRFGLLKLADTVLAEKGKGLILRNYGILTEGTTVGEAALFVYEYGAELGEVAVRGGGGEEVSGCPEETSQAN